ncbi:MAG TPA: MEDS domain-containing protein [Bacillota bacterium]|nr:MEDS domain-containing protein [Bacillota bacterium]
MNTSPKKTPRDTVFLNKIPWGTHVCGFYRTQDDLINMLIPYFKFGLKNNEFCMWITSDPINNNEAKQILTEYIPNINYYLDKGQMELIPYAEWYLRDGKFDGANILSSWVKKVSEALAKGYKGVRISGNTTWLNKEDWSVFQYYESIVDNSIDCLKMTAICTYQINNCNGFEMVDIMKNHKYFFVSDENIYSIINDTARLERLDIMSKMSASIAHEIRNPITSIKGFLQLLQQKSEYKKHTHYFDIMLEEIDRISGIINEFLSLARNRESDFTRENLNDIINAILPLVRADAIKNDNNVTTELGNIPEISMISRDIRQLVLNLMRNGLEAMPGGGNLTVKTYVLDGKVVLEVSDEGTGIDPGIAEKIFLPFFTTKNSGTGLGLAICNNIAVHHNAMIKYKTGPAGSTFYVQFNLN